MLRVVRLSGAYFYAVEASEPWSVQAMPAAELTPRVLPAAEHLISYHILTTGHCWGGLLDDRPVEMLPGDIIVFPHGDAHLMSSEPGLRASPGSYGISPERYLSTVVLGSGETRTTFVCGFLGCDRRPFNPLLGALPRRLLVRGLARNWIDGFAARVVEESRASRPGAETVLARLAELMFIEVLRAHLENLPADQRGWLAGLRDPITAAVLSRLHSRPAHPWTLASLAREIATSRTVLAERFSHFVGQPPMQYLTHWRMQVAAGLLAETTMKVATIASRVGYESEAAFSRAFRKATGLAPRQWSDPATRERLTPGTRASPGRSHP